MGIKRSDSAGTLKVRIGDAALTAKYAREAKEAAEQAAAAAEAAVHLPLPGENGNWKIWDQSSRSYVDSGKGCRGETGPQGQQGEPGEISLAQLNAALALKQNLLSFDDAPASGSENPVKSGGIKTALDAVGSLAGKAYSAATVTGATAGFTAEAAGLPLKKLLVNIIPAQAGSGMPTTANARTISGWTGCALSHSGADTGSPVTTNISWQHEAGTVYGGTLDVIAGLLTVTKACVDMGGLNWLKVTAGYMAVNKDNVQNTTGLNPKRSAGLSLLCSVFDDSLLAATANQIRIMTYDYADTETFITAVNGKQLCFELETPAVYQLTPKEVVTLLGQNNIWADCGEVGVAYGAYMEAVNDHVDRVSDTLLSLTSCIAPVENGAVSTEAYAQGAFFLRGGRFCKAKTAIAEGAAFTLNTNYEITTVAAALAALQ